MGVAGGKASGMVEGERYGQLGKIWANVFS